MPYISAFIRELKTTLVVGSSALHVSLLYTIVVGTALIVLPYECLHKILPTLFCICGTLVMQVSIRELFEEDYTCGALEQLLIQDILPEIMILMKLLAHWICVVLPICIISMLLDFVILGDSVRNMLGLGLALGASLLIVSFISSVGHTLVLGGEKGLVVAQVLTFPVLVSVVICFNLMLQLLRDAAAPSQAFTVLVLGASMLCLVPLSIFFVISAVKLAVEQN
ncbi:heme exporter protein CcmB [Anaplasma bovis]